jgi:C-terminal processing protease CtpA/Prc
VSGNIEIGILKQFTITFDYARQRLIFEPNRNYGKPDVFDRSGMRLRTEGDRWTVTLVYPGGAAQQAGIHQGDVVLRINGKSAEVLDRYAVHELFTGPTGTRIGLSMGAGASMRDISLQLRDIL